MRDEGSLFYGQPSSQNQFMLARQGFVLVGSTSARTGQLHTTMPVLPGPGSSRPSTYMQGNETTYYVAWSLVSGG